MKNKIKCPKCNHEWNTKSKLIKVTCPSCNYKIKNLAVFLLFIITFSFFFMVSVFADEGNFGFSDSVEVTVVRGVNSSYINQTNSSNFSKVIRILNQGLSLFNFADGKNDYINTSEEAQLNSQTESQQTEANKDEGTSLSSFGWGWGIFWFIIGASIGCGACILIYRHVYGKEEES